ncbi:GNAT family N-acetyltransferase [Cellulomonas marina]|uniref:Ribosomal protein S18 acetylase RimI n=1 Tax=Cellulomonas marina TaxID=988821 RepID=A0A1I0ZYH9_9CELL|nr:GNAT family N-acetyltransferase [Cellulomonas marina]GIG29459.1 hypothetical protein Cma02nite_20590 [Cellulomonas marina]SFB30607.1 Ribosomal protein S18 acetylase RimI [Cellulomonas marina]
MRPAPVVLPVRSEDLDDVVRLALAGREEAAGAQVCTGDPDRLRAQLGAYLGSPGGRGLVVSVDGHPLGMLLARVVGPSPFSDAVVLEVETIYVAAEARRRGLGHALMAGAADVAAASGATEVFCAGLPGARSMQRFLARLGFSPAAGHRVATTGVLQRRLAQDALAVPTGAGNRHTRLLGVLEARRQARASRSMQVSLPVATLRPDASSTVTS